MCLVMLKSITFLIETWGSQSHIESVAFYISSLPSEGYPVNVWILIPSSLTSRTQDTTPWELHVFNL